jgi:hypothetical protein
MLKQLLFFPCPLFQRFFVIVWRVFNTISKQEEKEVDLWGVNQDDNKP